MPLAPGSDRATISSNISELTHHGTRPRSHSQIVAIALSNADKHPHRAFGGGLGGSSLHIDTPKLNLGHAGHLMSPSEGTPWWTRSEARGMGRGFAAGGGIGHFQEGGMMSPSQGSPWWERQEARQINDIPFHGGLIGGSGAGRTDRLPLAVTSESHVIPSDVVSSLGQGHTASGARMLQGILGTGTGPYGTPLPQAIHGHGPPRPPAGMPLQRPMGFEEGGDVRPTSILAASGEFVATRDQVEALGQRAIAASKARKGESALAAGHRLLDEMIHNVRQFQIRWLKTAPAPKK